MKEKKTDRKAAKMAKKEEKR
jgi:hypothetical protein